MTTAAARGEGAGAGPTGLAAGALGVVPLPADTLIYLAGGPTIAALTTVPPPSARPGPVRR